MAFEDPQTPATEYPAGDKKKILHVFNELQDRRSHHATLVNNLEYLEEQTTEKELKLDSAEESFLEQVYRSELEELDPLKPLTRKATKRYEPDEQDCQQKGLLDGNPATIRPDYQPLFISLKKATIEKAAWEDEIKSLELTKWLGLSLSNITSSYVASSKETVSNARSPAMQNWRIL